LRGVLIDISERKKASLALESSEQRFKDIVEVSSDWIWECDEELKFTYFSERFTQVTGVPKEQVLGKTRNELASDTTADWESHLDDLEARRPFRAFSYAVKDADDETRHWMVSGRPVFDENGKFKGYRGTGADRTAEVRDEAELIQHRDHLQELVNDATVELKERADELHQALAKEKELNQLQSQFVSIASHEFRTPLAIIDGAAQRLSRRAEKLTPEDTVKRVDKIRNAVARMTQLMESTLVAARLEAGRPTIEVSDCDVGSIIREICDRQQDIAQNHNIVCEIRDLPISIKADPGALEQIFTNLLSNAVKYAQHSPEIQVTAFLEGKEVVVHVRDYGIGIDEEDLPNMFQRFFRARTSAGIAGTGIGLNLVKTLVELHDGDIGVESKKDEGSLFRVRLPVEGPAASNELEGQVA
jgi:PAS domain S-box-containing protein